MPRRTETATTRPRRSEAGFSIVEVLVAGTILLSALVAVASLTGTIFKVGANSRFKQQATEIAANHDTSLQTVFPPFFIPPNGATWSPTSYEECASGSAHDVVNSPSC